MGAPVIEIANNEHKKASALNHALDVILPALRLGDRIVIADADSILPQTWIQPATLALDSDEQMGAVCASFHGQDRLEVDSPPAAERVPPRRPQHTSARCRAPSPVSGGDHVRGWGAARYFVGMV